MLIFVKRAGDVRFDQLLEVYRQSNEKAAAQLPNVSGEFALELAEQNFRQYLREVFFRTDGAILAVWEEAGRYVSATRLEPYRNGLLLAGVETAPDDRRKGYAARLIRGIQEQMHHLDVSCLYSHVHKKNTPSLSLHEKLGFRVISDMAVYLDGSVDNRSVTMRYGK